MTDGNLSTATTADAAQRALEPLFGRHRVVSLNGGVELTHQAVKLGPSLRLWQVIHRSPVEINIPQLADGYVFTLALAGGFQATVAGRTIVAAAEQVGTSPLGVVLNPGDAVQLTLHAGEVLALHAMRDLAERMARAMAPGRDLDLENKPLRFDTVMNEATAGLVLSAAEQTGILPPARRHAG